MTGTIKNLNGEKGFGFIRPEGNGKDLFFHYSDLTEGGRREFDALETGDRVEFEEGDGPKGPRAQDVRRI